MNSDWNYRLHSVLPDVAWPPFPADGAARQLAMLWQLEQMQWWPAGKLRAMQLRQLGSLLEYASSHSAFYRERLEAVGYTPKAGKVEEELWHKIPLLTRQELQRFPDRIECTVSPKDHGKKMKVSSSGSTGRPVTLYRTEVTQFLFAAFALREHHWHRRDFSQSYAAIRYVAPTQGELPPEGKPVKGWGAWVDSIFHTGDGWLLGIDTPIDEQIKWLTGINPVYLLTYPSNLLALARRMRERHIRLPALREVRTISETLLPETRKVCQEVLGVPLVDAYSCNEIGNLAIQCPQHDHYHVNAEHVLLEVLDEGNRPCTPGQTGRVVVTDLHNYAMPLIRYELGDYAQTGDDCDCGRGLPVITRILGRHRNMIELPTGERFWPAARSADIVEITGAQIEQVQLVQTEFDHIEVRLLTAARLDAAQEQALENYLHKVLRYPFRLSFEICKEIPRSKSGKYEEFLCEIGDRAGR